ncbi:hypothetical protein GOV05_04275 [Candidatus Woesearchaeota archaeon]|nr:hypothetical protein [Candidatus Woesearchaeota archaeon]
MQSKKSLFIISILLLLSSVFVFAYHGSGKIYLLAVSETDDDVFVGSVADLFIDIKPGSGRVFIDTYPFTKLDTQFTTRYAKQVACDYTNTDCDEYDFFYTIKAGSTIIGGPSAGAATALLTAAMLEDKLIPRSISVTGTISSGGLIGPVGGIEEKVKAATKKGITTVYIPKIHNLNGTNITTLSEEYDVEIIEVFSFDDLYLDVFGGIPKPDVEIIPSKTYTEAMKSISENLCDDANNLLIFLKDDNNTNSSVINSSEALYNKSINETNTNDFYSAASYCFGAATRLETQRMKLLNDSELNEELLNASTKYLIFLNQIDEKRIRSFTDLQAFMITRERLSEAAQSLFSINTSNITSSDRADLAYSIMRLNSAEYWSEFFDLEVNEEFVFDDDALLGSCLEKLREVEGYLNYVDTYLTGFSSSREKLDLGYDHYYRGDYALCLFKAIKTKSDMELLLSTLNVGFDDVQELIDQKILIAKRSIDNNVKKGVFPILAYSYLSYAESLRFDEPFSALLYLEYAASMSDLSIYFEKEPQSQTSFFSLVPTEYFVFFGFGLITGASFVALISLLVFNLNKKSKKKRKAYFFLKKK